MRFPEPNEVQERDRVAARRPGRVGCPAAQPRHAGCPHGVRDAALPRRVPERSPGRRAATASMVADLARPHTAAAPAAIRAVLPFGVDGGRLAVARHCTAPGRRSTGAARRAVAGAGAGGARDALRQSLRPLRAGRSACGERPPAPGVAALSPVFGDHHGLWLRCGHGRALNLALAA